MSERGRRLPDYLFARTLMIYAPTFHLLHIIRGKPATVAPPNAFSADAGDAVIAGGGAGWKLASFI